MEELAQAHEWLESTLYSLVEHPEQLKITRTVWGKDAKFEVFAAESDRGYLIGKAGHTARAIRLLLNARGKKDGRVYQLDIERTGDQ